MSTLVTDHFPDISDFEELLGAAESEARTGWEMDFTSEMRVKYTQFEERMYLSDKQVAQLKRIAKEQ